MTFFDGDYGYRAIVQFGDTANNGRVVCITAISVKFDKAFENIFDIIKPGRSFAVAANFTRS